MKHKTRNNGFIPTLERLGDRIMPAFGIVAWWQGGTSNSWQDKTNWILNGTQNTNPDHWPGQNPGVFDVAMFTNNSGAPCTDGPGQSCPVYLQLFPSYTGTLTLHVNLSVLSDTNFQTFLSNGTIDDGGWSQNGVNFQGGSLVMGGSGNTWGSNGGSATAFVSANLDSSLAGGIKITSSVTNNAGQASLQVAGPARAFMGNIVVGDPSDTQNDFITVGGLQQQNAMTGAIQFQGTAPKISIEAGTGSGQISELSLAQPNSPTTTNGDLLSTTTGTLIIEDQNATNSGQAILGFLNGATGGITEMDFATTLQGHGNAYMKMNQGRLHTPSSVKATAGAIYFFATGSTLQADQGVSLLEDASNAVGGQLATNYSCKIDGTFTQNGKDTYLTIGDGTKNNATVNLTVTGAVNLAAGRMRVAIGHAPGTAANNCDALIGQSSVTIGTGETLIVDRDLYYKATVWYNVIQAAVGGLAGDFGNWIAGNYTGVVKHHPDPTNTYYQVQ